MTLKHFPWVYYMIICHVGPPWGHSGTHALWSNLGHFRNSQACSHSKLLESISCTNVAALHSIEKRFYLNDNSGRYVSSNISLVINDLIHSIHNWLNNIVKHITSPRIWTFTVLQSLALHTAGQRPLEGSCAVVTPRPLWPWLQRIQFTTNLPGWNDYHQQNNLMNLIVYYSKYLICLK